MTLKTIGRSSIILLSVSLLGCLLCQYAQAAPEAPSWIDYVEKRNADDLANSVLPDYSYAGYHFSEKEIPETSSWLIIDVTHYGAMPNDANYDDAGIQAAIDAAQAGGMPTVVYFPAGKYRVSSETTKNTPIVVNLSDFAIAAMSWSDISELVPFADAWLECSLVPTCATE